MVRCQFYTKIGACRHGDKCSKAHIKPVSSKCILITHIFNSKTMGSQFNDFYLDLFRKVATYGEVKAMVVCENENSHLNGNVYVKYTLNSLAESAVTALNQEWYDSRPVHCELSPVDVLGEAKCRAHDTKSCTRGAHCNYMHVHSVDEQYLNMLYRAQQKMVLLRHQQAAQAAEKTLQQPPQPALSTFDVLTKMFTE